MTFVIVEACGMPISSNRMIACLRFEDVKEAR